MARAKKADKEDSNKLELDLESMSFNEIAVLRQEVLEVFERKSIQQNAEIKINELNKQFQNASGTGPNLNEWTQPTSMLDAYNLNDLVPHNGVLYESITVGNFSEPSEHNIQWVEIGEVPEDYDPDNPLASFIVSENPPPALFENRPDEDTINGWPVGLSRAMAADLNDNGEDLQPMEFEEWASFKPYFEGEKVTFDGAVYKCVNGHDASDESPFVSDDWKVI